MPARKLGDVAEGEIVKINENGSLVDFYVAKHRYESAINEPTRTLVVRKDAKIEKEWDLSNRFEYANSTIDVWLNNTYKSMLDQSMQKAIGDTTFYYTPGVKNGAVKKLTRSIFLLSLEELGKTYSGVNADGTSLPISETLIPVYLNDAEDGQWTRSVLTPHSFSPMRVDEDGVVYASSGNYREGIRPVFTLDASISVIDGVVIANSAPDSPSTITVPENIFGGEDTSIIWSAATDPDGNLDGYIVERSYDGGSSWSQVYQGRSTSATVSIPFGTETVMFRVCAYDTYGEKSGWTTSPNRVVINNHAPTAPPSISVPLSPSGGDKLTITWTASTDFDGNLEGYELERQWDGAGAFTQIYKGAALSFQDDIPKAEHTSVVYRVRAYDSFASYSSYTTSPSRTIDNNTAPVIVCDLSGDLGEKSEGFSIQYTIKDTEKQEVTVIEKVGDLVKRTYKPTLDSSNTFEITGEYFQKILNGAQTVQIVATDSAGKSSTLELTFTKAVHKAVITLSEPLAVEEQITVAVLAITGKIPADATQLVELTNNGNDLEPVWEDATADVKAGRNYVFKNKSQTAGWAFNFRVTVERGESGEDGNIVSIQGGFQ